MNSKYRYYYNGTFKSVLNSIGFEFDLNENAPEGISGYGDNIDGVYSRYFQLSAISYTLSTKPLFGLGSGCEQRGDIQYFYKGKWRQGWGYDLGIVEIICSEGLLGFLGYFSLFLSFFVSLLKNKKILPIYRTEFVLCFLLVLAYLLCLLSTVNMPYFLFFITAYIFSHKKTNI